MGLQFGGRILKLVYGIFEVACVFDILYSWQGGFLGRVHRWEGRRSACRRRMIRDFYRIERSVSCSCSKNECGRSLDISGIVRAHGVYVVLRP